MLTYLSDKACHAHKSFEGKTRICFLSLSPLNKFIAYVELTDFKSVSVNSFILNIFLTVASEASCLGIVRCWNLTVP